MENSGVGDLTRKNRFGSYFNSSSGSISGVKTSKVLLEEVMRERPSPSSDDDDDDDDDDGWWSSLVSWIRIVVCFVILIFTTFIWTLIMLLIFPWPNKRIRQGNLYGHVTGRLLVWILGNPINIEGAEYSNEKAIYISNHASIIDTFLTMWLTPTGTVAIARKEIIWWPLFGQLYVLAKNVRIDLSNPTAAIESMQETARALVKNNLSVMIFPEGTRSKNGRLLQFKKGFVHLALQSHHPIVPIILIGTHLAWRKDSLHVRPVPITVKYLPPITTDDWTADKIQNYITMVHNVYINNLPESQRPAEP